MAVFFSGPGQTYSNAAFIDEYIKEFGWSHTEVSSLYSFATLIAGFVMIGVGNFIDRFGQGSMTLIPNTLVTQWFIRKRGLAFSLMMLGSFSSAMLFPIINVWLISEWAGGLPGSSGALRCS